MDRPEMEILVHIAAPAMAADDAKYRTLAAAYLAFEPRTKTAVVTHAQMGTGEDIECTEESQPEDELPRPQSSIQSPLLSFRSVANNLSSPLPPQAAGGCIPESQLSWRAPPSVIQDSMPDNDLVYPQYCTPTRLLEHYASTTLDSSQPISSPVPQGRQTPTPALPNSHEEFPRQEDDDAANKQPSEVKDGSAGTTDSPRPGKSRKSPVASARSAVTEEPRGPSSSCHGRQARPTSPFRAESEPPLAKRPRTSRDPPCEKPMIRSASDLGPRIRGAGILPAHHQPSTYDKLEILSPPPPTEKRERRPEDMITDVLASLARNLDLEKRFRPESQTRELRPFERGYWLVDCTTWDPDLKRSAWEYLAKYLGSGAAGWGTTCKRDAAFSWIRLYCWGCVVGHMYLVLYLMSKRRVLYTGTSWIAADGAPVVVMGAKQAPA
ncbi:71075b01-9e0f-4cc8-a37e-ba485089cbeb [Thermothielavioides terrestris]|uniref:71075b01-9e0f-4cc8-a37e-ba485089cbeb n=1 Tax=Thermothielavioides terrestris TaxID=2587410 RepID=A0A446BA83_9PEZI|nr:71075b01-9e0f-4cc8-a37e-ba485089cbeb [Thermothielavioides terrestris]